MNEPTLSSVHADLVSRLQQDERLRAVEQQVAALAVLPGELVRMEGRIMTGISETRQAAENSKSKLWPALSVAVAFAALLLLIAQPLYS